MSITFDNKQKTLQSIVCLGAHSDDIEIGCGGTILRLLENNPNLIVHWIVFSSYHFRTQEAIKSANLFLNRTERKNIVIKNFQDGYFPYTGAEIKDYFEQLKRELTPDLIFTHYRYDLHQDHRLISELTWNTFRDHFILEYEVPKFDGDLGSPNFFVHLDESICKKKITYILNCFQSQKQKNWFSEDTFFALLRLRGVESCAPNKFAEAFFCRKIVF
ncbi:MAG: PIG-L deacetylase family protein [bacterium]